MLTMPIKIRLENILKQNMCQIVITKKLINYLKINNSLNQNFRLLEVCNFELKSYFWHSSLGIPNVDYNNLLLKQLVIVDRKNLIEKSTNTDEFVASLMEV